MGKTRMDERGRILIPSQKRKKLRLKPGIPKPLQVQSKKQNWGKEAFLDAGEATFGD